MSLVIRTVKHSISQGQAGYDAAAPIDLDDDSAPIVRRPKDQKPKIGEANADDADAREAALLVSSDPMLLAYLTPTDVRDPPCFQAELARLRERKRKQSSASVDVSDGESDSKASIKRRMSKTLDSKKAVDGSRVDLTLDSD